MGCSIYSLTGLTLTCDSNKGGIKTVLIANYDEAAANALAALVEGESGATDIAVSAITAQTGLTWYRYDFKRNTGSMTSTLNVDEAAGTNYVTTEVVLQFNRMETTKRIEMRALSLNELSVIVVDSNNKAWFLGLNEPVVASAGTGQTGTAKADGNYYQITLQANDDTYPFEVNGDISNLPVNNA